MKLSEADIACIHALFKDYQWFVDHADELYTLPYMIVSPKERETVLRPYSAVRDRIANAAPLLLKVLSMDLPAGFTLLRTIDEQCLAWNGNEQLGVHGPVSEFQARLWCWENEHFNDDIAHSLWLRDIEQQCKQKKIEIEADEAVGDCSATLCYSSNDGHGAVLDQAMIENMFSSYRGYRE